MYMLDQILAVLAVLLPTLFAVVIEVASKEIRAHPYWRIGVLAFGVGLSALTWVQISRNDGAHAREIERQHNEMERQHTDIVNLTGELRQSETLRQVDSAYLKAKLEDYAQLSKLAPALMQMAQTGEEFQRRQYQEKMTSNRELFDLTMSVVQKTRDFATKYETLETQRAFRPFPPNLATMTDDERRQAALQWSQDAGQERSQQHAEFVNTILPGAVYARDEFRKKKIKEPDLSGFERSEVNGCFNGLLAGIHPERRMADYLEYMAKQLPLK
jgi:hypothetical protein